MSVPCDKSRIISPFFPSLFRIASVNVAKHLLQEFDIVILDRVSKDIQHGIPTRVNKDSQSYLKKKRAREKFQFIPAHLRHYVFQDIISIYWDMEAWDEEHSCILDSYKSGFFLRSDGTIDRIATAKNLVRNEEIDIRKRFHFACMYCLEEDILNLWKEMVTSEEIKDLETGDKFMTSFWVKWINEGSRVPWLQALKEYLVIPQSLSICPPCRFSSFFPLLQPEDRKTFLTHFEFSSYDDFRFCLYSATKAEEVKILEKNAGLLLLLYLQSPMQSSFLETAERVWRFLDVDSFFTVLKVISFCTKFRRTFDFCKLFLDFWNKSPIDLRNNLKENPIMSKTVDSILNKISRKRKKECISDFNQKKWIRRSGRLERKT